MTASAIPSTEKNARWNAMVRACMAGYVDAFSLLKFKVFTSFMSGNTTSAGMKTAEARFGEAMHDFLPIPSFLLGSFFGVLLQKKRTAESTFRASMTVVLLLLGGACALRFAAPDAVGIVLLATAMGLLNTTVAQVGGQSVNLGFVTGDLKSLGEQLAKAANKSPVQESQGPWDTHLNRAATLGSVWGAFLAGGIAGASMGVHLANWTLAVPTLVLFMLACLELRAGKR